MRTTEAQRQTSLAISKRRGETRSAWQYTGAEGKRIEWPDYWMKKKAAKAKKK